MVSLISASRRTDIPHFFGSWFAERRKAGFASYRNAFGGEGCASLRDQDVVAYLFWTKYARPFADQLRALRGDGVPFAFQYTITGYGAEIESRIPNRSRAIEDFLAIASKLPDPACIQWRFDPIVLSGSHDVDFHLRPGKVPPEQVPDNRLQNIKHRRRIVARSITRSRPNSG